MTDPDQIETHTLQDGDTRVTILSLGCITQDWQIAVNGAATRVVLGYRDPASYLHNPARIGAIVGRVANRIAGSRFTLDGQVYGLPANNGPNHLHGGPEGISTCNWHMDRDGQRAVRLSHHSPHGAGGYPGAVQFEVTITLNGTTLRYDMRAMPDRPTAVNMAQHNYYTLGLDQTIRDLSLFVAADSFTPNGPNLIPTGEIATLDGEPFDFRAPRTIASADPDGHGIDHNYMLQSGMSPSATVTAPNGIQLDVASDQTGLQVYTATNLTETATPLDGQKHGPFTGLCLEPQGIPNAVNEPAFPSIIISPEQPYHQILDVSITATRS